MKWPFSSKPKLTKLQLGNQRLAANDYTGAIKLFLAHANEVAKQAPTAFAKIAECYRRSNRLERPKVVAPGVTLVSEGDLASAEYYYRLALEKDRHHFASLKGLANVLPGDSEERLRCLEGAIDIQPDTLMLTELGDSYRRRGDAARGYEFYRKCSAQAERPNCIPAPTSGLPRVGAAGRGRGMGGSLACCGSDKAESRWSCGERITWCGGPSRRVSFLWFESRRVAGSGSDRQFVVPPMQHVAARHLTPTRRWRRLSLVVIVAAATGVAAAIVRPRIGGRIHYEMLTSVFVVLPAICVCLTLSLRRVPWRQAVGWLVLEVSAAYLIFFAAFWVVFRHVWDKHMLSGTIAFWLIFVGLSAALLIGWQQWRCPMVGPYCPACSYCLIGVAIDRCPECGRAFTLEELGVTREELRAPTVVPSHTPVGRSGG